MWKKAIASLLVFIVIFSISTVGYATSMGKIKPKVDLSKYQINTPKEDSSSSNKKIVLISGNAPKDTSVVIEVYGAVDLTGKNYTLAKLPKGGDYVFISSQTIKSGAAGGFGAEIELIRGINKIIITFNVEGVPSKEKIIYYYEAERIDKIVNNLEVLPSTK